MPKEKTLESKVRKFPAYGGFAVELLKHVAEQNKGLMFLELWGQCFPNLSDTKALQLAKKFKKDLDPRNIYVTKSKTSGYRLYNAHRTEEIKAKEGKFNFKEHTSLIAKEWDKLDDKAKEQWYEKAAKENEEYYQQLQEVEEKIRKGELAESPFRTPDRPAKLTGFNVYCREQRPTVLEQNPNIANNEVMKKLAEMWATLTEAEQGQWKEKAEVENKKNEEEFHSESPVSSPSPSPSPKSKSPKPKSSPAPKSPAPSSPAKKPLKKVAKPAKK